MEDYFPRVGDTWERGRTRITLIEKLPWRNLWEAKIMHRQVWRNWPPAPPIGFESVLPQNFVGDGWKLVGRLKQ